MLVAVLVGAAGCVTAPMDGSEVASTSASVRFEGYMNNTGRDVTIQASATGRSFTTVTNARSGGRAYSVWDVDWYRWSAYAPIAARHWNRGATGAYTFVKAQSGVQLFNTNQRLWSCMGQSDSLPDFQRDCTEPVAILCTQDYLPNGSRRSLCPGRGVVAHRSDDS
jgi:hypothetical protein